MRWSVAMRTHSAGDPVLSPSGSFLIQKWDEESNPYAVSRPVNAKQRDLWWHLALGGLSVASIVLGLILFFMSRIDVPSAWTERPAHLWRACGRIRTC